MADGDMADGGMVDRSRRPVTGAGLEAVRGLGARLLPRRVSLGWFVGVMGLFGLAFILGALALLAFDQRARLRQEAARDLTSSAYQLADHASRLFEVSDVALRGAAALAGSRSWDEIAASRPLWAELGALRSALPYVEDVWLNDASGRLRLTSHAFPAPASSVADRDVFQAVTGPQPASPAQTTPAQTTLAQTSQDHPADRLAVGGRIVGHVTGQPTFMLARRLDNPDGSPRGLVSATADLAYFERYWSQVPLPYDARVSLLRTGTLDTLDGYQAAGAAPVEGPPAGLGAALAAHPAEGLLRGAGRLGAYRQVDGLPLVLVVSVSERALRAAWLGRLRGYGLFAAAAACALGLLTWLAFRQALVERRATRALVDAQHGLEAAKERLEAANAGLRAEAAQREAAEALRESAEAQLRQSHKMQAVGQLAGGVAHDFNNLLTVVLGNLDMLRRRLGETRPGALRPTAVDPRLTRLLDHAEQGATRAAALTQRLLAFSRQQPLSPQAVDVNALVAGVAEILPRTLGERIRVVTRLGPGAGRAHIDPGSRENALLNLAVNARDAMPAGGTLTIETMVAEAGPPVGRAVRLAVADTGTGMTPDVVARLFEPFFTTKPLGKGTGLGLAQVYGFVEQSRGRIEVTSEPGQGTRFEISLPRLAGEPARGDGATGLAAATGPAQTAGQGGPLPHPQEAT